MALEEELFTVFARFFNEQPYLAFGLLALAGVVLLRNRNRRAFLLALLIAYALTPVLKDFYGVSRPCAGVEACPEGFGFPSQHATLSFLLAAASWGEPINAVFLAFALAVGWSRVFLGVHTWDQVAAGFALGFFLVMFSETLLAHLERRFPWLRPRERAKPAPARELSHEYEAGRQLIHMLFGVFFVLLGALLPRDEMLLFLLFFLSFGLLVSTLKSRGLRLPFFDAFLMRFERPGREPGRGVVMYAGGLLLLFSFAPSHSFALGVAGILALGDGLATLIGKKGWTRLPWNPAKTVRGTMAFFAGGFLASAWFLGPLPALFYSAVLALLESVEWGMDDNLFVPLAGLLVHLGTGVL